ncbi:MAG: hypothetical protein ABIO72_01545 [Patescibacteria group bacterium]
MNAFIKIVLLLIGILSLVAFPLVAFRLIQGPIYSDEEWFNLERPVINEAIAAKDFHVCEKLPKKIRVTICAKGPGTCYAPEDRAPIEDCFNAYNETFYDPALCEFMETPFCFQDIAIHTKNPDLCERVDSDHTGEHWRYYRNLCLFSVAANLSEADGIEPSSLCKRMVPDEPGHTVFQDCVAHFPTPPAN